MTNIELQLLATMLHSGKFDPIIKGELTQDLLITNEGKILFNFIAGFRAETGGTARYPSLSIVKSRFRNAKFVIPDPSPGDTVPALLHEVKLQKTRADMRVIAQDLLDGADSDDPLTTLTSHAATLRDLTKTQAPSKQSSLKDAVFEALAGYADKDLLPFGLPWPWKTLQEHTRGMQRKELIIVSGRPKTRKTFVACYVLANAVEAHGQRALIFSPEMPPRQVMMRVIAMMAKVRYTEFKNSSLDALEYARFTKLVQDFGMLDTESEDQYKLKIRRLFDAEGLPDHAFPSIDIVQSTGKPVSWLEGQISAFEPDIVLFDSLYRQAPDVSRKADTETQKVASVSRAIKDLAMEANVVAMATHQINREGEKIVGSLSNLGMTDALGQDADVVLRVFTGKLNGQDVSALVVLGGRELPVDGVMIHNRPCIDFSEIGPITDESQVRMLMKQEQDRDAKEAADKTRQGVMGTGNAHASITDDPLEEPVPVATKPPKVRLNNTKAASRAVKLVAKKNGKAKERS